MKHFFLVALFHVTFLVQGYSQKTLVLQPGPEDGYDTYVNSSIPDVTCGDWIVMIACGWTFGGIDGIGRSLMRFDLSQIPTSACIQDAKLNLYYQEGTFAPQTGENASYLEKILQPWNEATTTWNTKPATTSFGSVFIPKTLLPDQDLTNIDVTDFVKGWALDPSTNYGFLHKLALEVPYNCVVYHSSDSPDSLKRPKLVITYFDCDAPVAGFSSSVQLPVVFFSDSSSHASLWWWDFGDGYYSTVQNPQHVYEQTGIYQVCLRVQDSCGSDSICKPVHVCSFPDPHFTFIKDESMVSFSDSSFQPISWYWDFGDGFYSDLKNPQHYFNKSGTYYVCEKVTNVCGEQTYCDSVTVIAASVNDNTNYCYLDVFPNPAHDNILVSVNVQKEGVMNIDLYNPQILKMYSFIKEIIHGENKIQLNIPGLPAGLYFLRIEFGENKRLIKLVIY